MDQKPTVYVGFSHEDQIWKDRLVQELRRLQADGSLGNWDIWDDSLLEPGEKWDEVITNVLDTAQAAILLISEAYLHADFPQKNEVPRLVERSRKEDGFRILPVLVGPSDWRSYDWLASIQMLPEDLVPLSERRPEDAGEELRSVAQRIAKVLPSPPPPPPPGGDLLPLSEIEGYRFSPTARAVVDRARQLAVGLTPMVPVTSSLLLFAMVEQGRQRRSGIPQFLWNYIADSAGSANYEEVRRRYVLGQRVREDVPLVPATADEGATQDANPSQEIARNALAVIQQAWLPRERQAGPPAEASSLRR